MKPTIGRIVHFQESGVLRAAIIAHVNDVDESLNLCVIREDGTTFARCDVAQAPANAFDAIDDKDKNAAEKRKEQAALREQRWTWPARV
jgi:hypothetical protein